MNIPIEKHLINGLRPHGPQRNAEYMAQAQNLLPTGRGLRPVPVPTVPPTGTALPAGVTYLHPTPQTIQMGAESLIAGNVTASGVLHTVDPTTPPTRVVRRGGDLATVTFSSVIATDAVTINGVTLTAIANGATPGANEFAIGAGGSVDSGAATNLAALINSLAATTMPGCYATAAGAVVTVSHTQAITAEASSGDSAKVIVALNTGTAAHEATLEAGGGVWRGAVGVIATNGKNTLFQSPFHGDESNATVKITTQPSTVLAVNAVAGLRNRLVIGGPTLGSAWLESAAWTSVLSAWRRGADMDYRRDLQINEDTTLVNGEWIAVSEYGGGAVDIPYVTTMAMLGMYGANTFADFEEVILSRIESGDIALLPAGGAVMGLLTIDQNHLIALTTSSAVLWEQADDIGWQFTLLRNVGGITARGCCLQGGTMESVWLSSQGDLYMYGERAKTYQGAEYCDGGVYRLGYREFLTGLTPASVSIVYDPLLQWYWIGDGTSTYVLTETGLGLSKKVHPTQLIRPNAENTLYGYGSVSGSAAVIAETEMFDGGVRGVREVTSVRLATADTDPSGWGASLGWRVRKGDAITYSTPVTTDTRGHAITKQGGIEHSVKLTASDCSKVDLDRVDVDVRLLAETKPSLRSVL